MQLKRIRQHWILAVLLLCGVLGVVSTYSRLSQTDDEGFHIACGMEWWKEGTYKKQALHPPVARVMDAAFPYLYFVMQNGKPWADMAPRDAYLYKLTLARMGTLPFYILSCVLVFVWSRRLYGYTAGLWSLALYITTSNITAHAGLATTDMAYTAVLLWALMATIDWLKTPSTRNSTLLGLSIGVMVGTKFSSLAHWPVAMYFIIMAQMLFNYRRGQPLLAVGKAHIANGFACVIPMVVLALALIYRFDFGPFVQGIKDAHRLSTRGFGVWLYGPLDHQGVWYFFPVVFFFKTNVSLMLATIVGSAAIIMGFRRNTALIEWLFPPLAAIGIMLISMNSDINLGVRHVLPLYPLLSIPAGYGLYWLWQQGAWKRGAAAAILLWQTVSFVQAYPEHLAYFNFMAGERPERITLDSDYDWGQDMIILDEALQERGITEAYLCARKDVYWNIHILAHAKILGCPKGPITGWIAVGRAFRLLMPNNFTWLNGYEAVQIGNSTLDLYYIPPEKAYVKP